MALEIKKEERESPQSLVRRFSKRVKLSGILLRARRNRFQIRNKSKNMRKRSALRKEEKKKEYEMMVKMGRIPDTRSRFK